MNLSKEHVGKTFTAEIGAIKTSGKIQFENGCFFLCQNEKDGSSCKDKLGYRYSWRLGAGTELTQNIASVTNLRIVEDYSHLYGKKVLVSLNSDFSDNKERILLYDLGPRVDSRFIVVMGGYEEEYRRNEQYEAFRCRYIKEIEPKPSIVIENGKVKLPNGTEISADDVKCMYDALKASEQSNDCR